MMKNTLLIFALVASASICAAAFEENVATLKARLEHASAEDRAEIAIRIAQLQTREADRLYRDGAVDQARAAVDEIVSSAEKARDAAVESKKHLKNVEIDTRKISEKLRDIKRTLAFDDQAPVDQAMKRLEDLRTSLLKEMFKKKEKK